MMSRKSIEEAKLRQYGLFDGFQYLNPFTGNVIQRTTANRRRIYRKIVEEEEEANRQRQRRRRWLLQVNNTVQKIRWSGLGQYNFEFVRNGFTLDLGVRERPTEQQIIRLVIGELIENTINNGYEHLIEDNGLMYRNRIGGVPESRDLVNIDHVDYVLTPVETQIQPLASRPTFDSDTAITDLLIGDEIPYDHSRLCTPENIEYFINSYAKLRLKRYGLRELVNHFCIIKGYDGNDKYGYLQTEGITSNDLIEWAKLYGQKKVNVYCVDPANKVFQSYNVGAFHSLVVKVNNDHTYLITNNPIRQQVIQNGCIKKRPIKEDVDAESIQYVLNSHNLSQQIAMTDKKCIVITGENWKNIVINYIEESGTIISELNTSNGEVTAFKCPVSEKAILIREDYKQMRKMYENLQNYKEHCPTIELPMNNTTYSGQGLGKLAMDLINDIVGIIPNSYYNETVLEHLNKFSYPRLVETYNYYFDRNANNQALDITKAHSWGRLNMLGDVPVYSIHDTIEPYDGKELKVGKYRIKSVYMFRGENIYIPENFYTHGFVKKLLEHNIITKDDIIEQYIAKTGLSSNLLVELTEFIFKVFDEKQAKLISNLQTGLFGKIYNKRQEAQLSTSWDMTQSMIEEGYFPKTLKDGLYMMTKTNKTRMKSDTRPIWNTIVETSIWNLYTKVVEHTTEDSLIHGIKVDCIYGENLIRPTIQDNKEIGSIHEITYSKLNKIPVYEPPAVLDHFENPKWKQKQLYFTNYKKLLSESCLIRGIGGSGKSYTLLKMLEYLKKDKYLILAPTNTAVARLKSENIEASTIDSALKISVNGYSKPKYGSENEFPFDYLFVDECYNTSMYHQRLIYNIWLSKPDLKVFYFGDKGQCLPVEVKDDQESNGVVIDYDMSLAWKQILGRVGTLSYNTKTGRYDDKLYTEVKQLENNGVPTIQLYDNQEDVKRFLAKTNKTVDVTNIEIMKNKEEFDLFILPSSKGSSKCKLTEMKLNIGDPVMAYTNNKKGLFHNNQQFSYKGKTDDDVTLTDRKDRELVLSIEVFQKNFVPAFCITINRCQGESMPCKFAILDGRILNKNDLNSAITRGKKWDNVYIDKLPRTIRPYKYTEYTVIQTSTYTVKGSIYKISKEGDVRVYIGQTKKTILERFNEHLISKSKDKFHLTITDDNIDDWKIELLEEAIYPNQRALDKRETYYISTYDEDMLFNTLLVKKKKKKKEKKVAVKKTKKLKGISDDKSRCAWLVKKKGLKKKRFSYRKCSKDEAYEKAKKYVLGIV